MKPSGDQIEAIRELSNGLEKNEENQVLLGVTGSGKLLQLLMLLIIFKNQH